MPDHDPTLSPDEPPVQTASVEPSMMPPDAPRQVGPYRIIERLGEGGMGAVFKAEQRQPIRRTVAIKLIRAGRDSREVIARFDSERQALARMDHPHIARVLDAGAGESGQPYFVMEYVPGIAITTFADNNKLSVRQRLELFVQVCGAIAHAHTKAILHRDIKASNVMAFLQDGRPTVKVIDFGVAKALTSDRLTDQTFATEHGLPIGTYDSMSPEQADGSPDVDTRTDVYSLGVLLYELLAGAKPFDRTTLGSAGDAEIRRIIKEVEPPRPSSRLTSSDSQTATKVASARQTRPDELARELRGELEWIPLKAMRKERDRRYANPQQMAADIQNYLAGLPLIAGPESAMYRARKFIRRHRAPVSASVAILVILVSSVIALTILWQESRRLQRLTEKKSAQLATALDELGAQKNLAQQSADALRRRNYGMSIISAQTAYELGNDFNLQQVLEECSADLCGWEWGRLKWLSDRSLLTIPVRGAGALAMRFTPDDRQLMTVDDRGVVRWWNCGDGSEARSLRLDSADGTRITALCAIDPQATLIAAFAPPGQSVELFDARDGAKRLGIVLPRTPASIAFAGNGHRLAVACRGGGIHIFDTNTGAEQHVLQPDTPNDHYVPQIAAGADTVVARDPIAVTAWDAESGKMIGTWPHPGFGLAVSRDGRNIAGSAALEANEPAVWQAPQFSALHPVRQRSTPADPGGTFVALEFSPDARRIVGSSYPPGKLRAWDAATGDLVATFRGHTEQPGLIAYSNDQARLATFAKGEIKIWSAEPPAEVGVWKDPASAIPAALVLGGASADGSRVLVASQRELRLIRGQDGATIASAPMVRPVAAITPDGKRIVVADSGGQIQTLDATTLSPRVTLLTGVRRIDQITMSSDGNHVAAIQLDADDRSAQGEPPIDALHVINVATGQKTVIRAEPRRFNLGSMLVQAGDAERLRGLSISPDGRFVVTVQIGGMGRTVIRDAATGAPLGEIPIAARSVIFANDSSRLIIAGESSLEMYDPATAEKIWTFQGGMEPILAVCISPDDRRIVTASRDARLSIWDTQTRQLLITVRLPEPAESITFADGGRKILAAARDRVYVLDSAWPPR